VARRGRRGRWARALRGVAGAAALSAALAAGAGAQEGAPSGLLPGPGPGAAPAEAPAEPPAPETIPLPEVAARAEAVETLLRTIRGEAKPEPAIAVIEEQLPELRRTLRAKAAETTTRLEDPSLQDLVDLEREWLAFHDQVEAWRTTLTGRASALDARLGQLTVRLGLFERTRAASPEMPDAVRSRIREVEGRIRQVMDAVEARRSVLLTLQGRVADEEQNASERLAAIEAARARIRSRLLEADSPPVWQLARTMAPGEWAQRVGESVQRDLGRLGRFVVDTRDALTLHLLLFAGALAGTLALRRRATALVEDDPRLAASAIAFQRPFSTALLLALTLGPAYLRAPAVVDQLRGLLLLAPVLRLLPGLLEPALVPAVWALAVLYGLDLARDLLAVAPELERAVLLLQTTAIALGLAWLLRPSRLHALPVDVRLPRALSSVMRAWMGLAASSCVANLLGYTMLATVLGEGTLRSAYAAIVLYGTLRVASTGLRVLFRSRPARALRMVRTHGRWLLRGGLRALRWATLVAWVAATLGSYLLLQPTLALLERALAASLHFGTVQLSLGAVLAFLLTLVSALALSRALRFVLEQDVLPRFALGRGVPQALSVTVQYALLVGGFLLAVSAAGVDLNRFTLLAGALGVGIGFGLQNVVNNFVSGLILLYERPVQVSDMVEVGPVFGEVRRIGIRSSTIRTWQGAEVILPNATLIQEQVINWTLSDRQRRVEVKVGVAYGSDPHQVMRLLDEVARANPDVLDEPPPSVLFTGFGNSSLDFELRAFTARFETYLRTLSDLTLAVHDALYAAGITIPFPQRDLHLRSIAPELRGAPAGGAPPESGGRGGGPGGEPEPDQ